MKTISKKFVILSLALTVMFVFSFSFVGAGTVTLSCSPASGNVGETIHCSGSHSGFGLLNAICNIRMAWGDGHTSLNSESIGHPYANPGTYVIRYTACNSHFGCQTSECASAQALVTITQSCTPDCSSVECGLDPVCGTKNCGTCDTDYVCQGGQCVRNQLACKETDNGKDYYTKGCTSSTMGTECDFCSAPHALTEYYCEGTTRKSTTYNCPSGTCTNGACVTMCTDEDEDGYGKTGQNSGCDLSGDDCNDNDANINPGASEVCDNNKDDDCDGKIDCNDPDCVNQHPCTSKWTCTDTDNGKDYNVKGTIKQFQPDGTQTFSNSDWCAGSVLKEYYCKAPSSDNGQLVELEQHACTNGCANGACKGTPNNKWTCTDTDNGKEYGIKGTVKILKPDGTIDINRDDKCNDDTSLTEYYCKASSSDDGNLLGIDYKVCTEGCSNGVCKESKPTECVDEDGDGYGKRGTTQYCANAYVDCDDTNFNIRPFLVDVCDNLDNDCDCLNNPKDTNGDGIFCGPGDENVDEDCTGVCGDGKVEATREECDKTNLSGRSCANFGCTGGTLSCTNYCKFDTSSCTGCSGGSCNNGIKDAGEECDGNKFGTMTCQLYGCTGGTLSCNTDCTINTSTCTGCGSASCGNGIKEENEECDGTDFGSKTCTDYGCTEGTLNCIGCKIYTNTCMGCTVPGNFELETISYSPSPAKDYANFQADGTGIEQIQVEVFDLSSSKVFTSSWTQGQTFRWDLKTTSGERVSNGAYIYKISAKGSGKTASKTSKMAIIPTDQPQPVPKTCPSNPHECNNREQWKNCISLLQRSQNSKENATICTNTVQKYSCRTAYELEKNAIEFYASNTAPNNLISPNEFSLIYQDWTDKTLGASYFVLTSFYLNDCDIEKIKSNGAPKINANMPNTASPNAVLQFDASGSFDEDGTISKYKWNFGDGASEEGSSTIHVYENIGNYVVTATAIDNVGDGSILAKEISIGGSASETEEEYTCYNATAGWNSIYISTSRDISVNAIGNGCDNVLIYGLNENGRLLQILDTLKSGKGYFIRTNNNCKLTSDIKQVDDSQIQLNKNWNLVGTTKDLAISKIKQNCGDAVSVLGINEEHTLYTELTTLKAGLGYLVRVPENCTVFQ